MKAAIICFSLTGWQTGERLCRGLSGQWTEEREQEEKRQEAQGLNRQRLEDQEQEVPELKNQKLELILEGKSRYLPDSIACSTKEWARKRFADSDCIIFIGACGIAVRSIAPYIQSKKTDPAVLVIDECGTYVISLLSGHLGGANELAAQAARILGAVPVISTATDLHKRFAVDVFAKKNHCEIRNMEAAKEVSAALLAGKTVGFYSEFPYEGELPEGLELCDREGHPAADVKVPGTGKRSADGKVPGTGKRSADGNVSETGKRSADGKIPEIGIAVTVHRECRPFASTVQVIPPAVTLGMGCKKGKEPEAVLAAAENCVEKLGIYREAVKCLASIDIKKEEQGFLTLSEEWGIPFVTYTAEELGEARGEFIPSSFVKEITGTDNVCERSAVRGSGQGILIQKKQGGNGVTAAAAMENWRAYFE